MSHDVEFFTISSGLYFPGFVGLYNSLRLSGHQEPVTVLERGMSERQKAIIRPHCRIVTLDYDVKNPCHLTAFPSQLDATGIVVLIDSDALVVDQLDPIIDHAREGKICLSRDPDESRFFDEWGKIFDVRNPLRKQTYYNTGLVAFSVEHWPELLGRWWESLKRVWDRPSIMEGASRKKDPTSQPDQDALNALLMSEFPPDSVFEIPSHWNVFPKNLASVNVEDRTSLRCSWRGERVKVVQASGRPKPWTWRRLTDRQKFFCYPNLLRRTLTARDIAIRLPNGMLPPWLWDNSFGEMMFTLFERWSNVRLLPSELRRQFSSLGS